MRLVKRSLSGRAFAIQFSEILSEFGEIIPWLKPIQSLRYATNGSFFRSEIESRLGCEDLVPYQFTTHDQSRDFVGGVLHFPVSPEVFSDARNQSIARKLAEEDASYVTCLQVRDVLRGSGHGRQLMERAVNSIPLSHPKVWAVCEPELVPWYQSFGARVLNRQDNSDDLIIIAWQA